MSLPPGLDQVWLLSEGMIVCRTLGGLTMMVQSLYGAHNMQDSQGHLQGKEPIDFFMIFFPWSGL
jgi:hypothetical protein